MLWGMLEAGYISSGRFGANWCATAIDLKRLCKMWQCCGMCSTRLCTCQPVPPSSHLYICYIYFYYVIVNRSTVLTRERERLHPRGQFVYFHLYFMFLFLHVRPFITPHKKIKKKTLDSAYVQAPMIDNLHVHVGPFWDNLFIVVSSAFSLKDNRASIKKSFIRWFRLQQTPQSTLLF